MNKKLIIATAAALVLGGFSVARAQTAAAVTQPGVTQPALAQPAKTAAPVTATTTATSPTTANVGKAGMVTTNVTLPNNPTNIPGTTANPVNPTGAPVATTPAPTTTTTAGLNKVEEKQELKVKVTGLTTADAAKALQADLGKANGVFTANVDYVTGNVVASAKKDLTADKLCNWVSDWAKAKNYKYTCSTAK